MKVRVLPCPGVSHALCAHDKVTTALSSLLSAVSRSALRLRLAVWPDWGTMGHSPSPTHWDGNAMLPPWAREIRQWGNMRHQSAAESGVKQLRRTGSCPPAAVCPWVKVKAAGRDTEAAAAGAGCHTAVLCLAGGGEAACCLLPPSEKLTTRLPIFPHPYAFQSLLQSITSQCRPQLLPGCRL